MLDMARVQEAFEASTDFTVGIEEEFAILDPETLSLEHRFEELKEAAGEDPVLAESVAGELIRSEIEIRSGRGETFADAVVKRQGMEGLNRIWEAPENLPTLAEVRDRFQVIPANPGKCLFDRPDHFRGNAQKLSSSVDDQTHDPLTELYADQPCAQRRSFARKTKTCSKIQRGYDLAA